VGAAGCGFEAGFRRQVEWLYQGLVVCSRGVRVAKWTPDARRRAMFAAYVLGLALLVLLLPARTTAPARIVFTEAAGPAEGVVFRTAGDAAAATGTLRDAFLAQEKERLREQDVNRLLNDHARLKESLREQTQRLHSIEQLQVAESRFRTLSAEVTSYDTSAMRHSVTVAAGDRDGVRQGLAVLAQGAVVGKVCEVGPWRSRVRLLTDPASLLACRVHRTRNLCVLRGTGGAYCSVDWLDKDALVGVGDVLVTAAVAPGLSGPQLVPAGLPVAALVGVERGRSDPMFLWVRAAPRVNVRRLEAVEVMIPLEEGPVGGGSSGVSSGPAGRGAAGVNDTPATTP